MKNFFKIIVEFLKKMSTDWNLKVADKLRKELPIITPKFPPVVKEVSESSNPIKETPKEKNKKPVKEIYSMYPYDILNYEEIFDKIKKDSDGISYNIEKKKTHTFPLSIIEPKEITNFYSLKKKPKSMIVLHFTVGFLMGDIATLIEQDSHLSVPFILGRNGTVYQLFNPEYWAYHLGRGAISGNGYNSKRSIGIELSNIGPLIRENGDLFNIYGSKYCGIEEEEYFIKLETPFRKYTYFATFTEAQYNSLRELLTYLCSRFNIPHKILPENKRYRLFSSKEEAQGFSGICTHINYRAYGKVDIGPAFDWHKII